MFNDLAKTLRPTYPTLVKNGKLVFEDALAALDTLGLKGGRKRTEARYSTNALLFCEEDLVKTTYKSKLAERGLTEAMLTDGKNSFF